MKTKKLIGGAVLPESTIKTFTEEDLQREFDFHLAEKIAKDMHKQGLISTDELQKISEKNRLVFCPYLVE